MPEKKILPLVEAKAAGDGPGTLEGYGSVFGSIDSYGDTIEAGAYVETLPTFLKDGFIAWGHDWADPVATPTDAREDTRGLFLTAEFHSTDEAQRARTITAERLARGKSMGLSIGYEAMEWEFRKVETPVRNQWGEFTDKVRVLKRINLFEVSLVTVPAEPKAQVTGAKNGMPFAKHAEQIMADLSAFAARAVELAEELKASDREPSEAKRQQMLALLETFSGLDAVRSDLERAAKAMEPVDVQRLHNEYQRIAARLNGVPV